MCTLSGIAESTYRMCYKGEVPSEPYIIQTGQQGRRVESRVQNRQRENELVRVKRVSQSVPRPPEAPLPVKPRPVSATKPCKVIDTKFGPMDMQTIETLHKKYRYTSIAQKSAAECDRHLPKPDPPTSLEPKADMVRLQAKRYEPRSEEWQDAVLWDRIQSRLPTNRPKSPQRERILSIRQLPNCLDEGRQNRIMNLVKTDGLANVFVRKCPGYAGYNPLCPPETELNDKKNTLGSSTTAMSVYYRQFPDTVYKNPKFARRGVFSKTITLTYPYNPFNKIGLEISPGKKGLYSSDEPFLGLVGLNLKV